jgi:GTPase SAR1 family protein
MDPQTPLETTSDALSTGLDRVTQMRQELADGLQTIAQIITQAETAGSDTSGGLSLETEVAKLQTQSDRYRQGRFRLLVLGDMKRGKSTLLNALLGEQLLPSAVNPCTAVPTIVQAGPAPQVTIHYHNSTGQNSTGQNSTGQNSTGQDAARLPEVISFEDFKRNYTIDPEAARQLEAESQLAFPDVLHAIVEHPLSLLGAGVELIDTPGLNDTEARNELSLNYAYNCNAILFVLDATQPCTLEERRYLQNYLRDRGLTIFFLINRWDELQAGLVNPDDDAALSEAIGKQREVFRTHLAEYCQTADGQDCYAQRVFEISALNALRSRLRQDDAALATTGFPEFLAELNRFLIDDRAQVELQQAQLVVEQVANRLNAAVERRIPLLGNTLEEFQAKIAAIESDFEQLHQINQDFQAQIRQKRDETAKSVSQHFRRYINDLEDTFMTDFVASQPNLGFFEFLDKNNRNQFYFSFKRAFERYMNDRLAAWEFIAKQQIATAFTELDDQAKRSTGAYAQVLEAMNEKLMGDRYSTGRINYKPESIAPIFDAMIDFMSAIPSNLNSVITPFSSFWQTVLLYACIVIAVNIAPFFLTLGMLTAILGGLGLISLQTESTRQKFLEATKREFAKQLPKIAEEYTPTVHQAVQKCFDAYGSQVDDRINADIRARKSELDNLLEQKHSREIDRDQEAQRLRSIVVDVDRAAEPIMAKVL